MGQKVAAVLGSVALGGLVGFGLRMLYPEANPGLHGFAGDIGLSDATYVVAGIWIVVSLIIGAAFRAAAGWLMQRLGGRRAAAATATAVLLGAMAAGPAVLAQTEEPQVFEYFAYVLADGEYDAWRSTGYEGEPRMLLFPEQFATCEVTFPEGPVRCAGTLTDIDAMFGGWPWMVDFTGSFLGIEDGEIGGEITGEYDYSGLFDFQYELANPTACWENVAAVAEECPGCADALRPDCVAADAEFHALWDPVDPSPAPGRITGDFRGTLFDDGWADMAFTMTRPGHVDGPFEVPAIEASGFIVLVPYDPGAVEAEIASILQPEGSETTATTNPAAVTTTPTDTTLVDEGGSFDDDLGPLSGNPFDDDLGPLSGDPFDDPSSPSLCGDWDCETPPVGLEGGLYGSAVLAGLLVHLAERPRQWRHDPDLHSDTHVDEGHMAGSTAITTSEYLQPELSASGRIGTSSAVDQYLSRLGMPETGVDLTAQWRGETPADGPPVSVPDPAPPGFESEVLDPGSPADPGISEAEQDAHRDLISSLEDPSVPDSVRQDHEWHQRQEIREALERRGIDVNELSSEERRAFGLDPPEES